VTETYATLGPRLLAAGFEPIPVAGKRPVTKGWEDVVLHPDQVEYWASNGKGHLNVGLRTGAVAAVDIDFYDGEVANRVAQAFVLRFGDAPCRIGREPKRLYLYLPKEPRTKINSALWLRPVPDEGEKENKVEVLGVGQQFVAYGIHPDTEQPYRWLGDQLSDLEVWMLPQIDLDEVAVWVRDELPLLVPETWTVKGSSSGGGAASDDPFDSIKQRHDDVDLEALRWMLEQLPAEYCDDRNLWRNAIFAVHHQFAGTEEEDEALDILDTWSSNSHKHVTGVVAAIWKEAKEQRGGGLVTIGSVKEWLGDTWARYRKTAVTTEQVAQSLEWHERISAADEVAIQGPLAAEIRATELTEVDRDALVKRVQRRLAELKGVTPSIAVVRNLLAAPRVVREVEGAMDIDDTLSMAPEWAREWVWIRTEGAFLHRKKKIHISRQAFDLEHKRHVADLVVAGPERDMEYEPSTRMFKHWGAKAVDKETFHPVMGEFFQMGGLEYVNMYRPELRVLPAAGWTEPGRKMRRALERHLSLLIPCKRERDLFRAWLAHQYLRPGVKVRWAPLLKGAPGDGKSLFGELLELVLGFDNVRLMNADTVQSSPFSGWVEGQCVTVFEEVKFHGHNRYDVVNKLKPYIANNRVEKHSKGLDPGSVFNVTNYLLLTNHEDAIPVEIGDRRYFILFSPFRLLSDMAVVLEGDYMMTVKEHFEEVFSSVRENPAQLALWLVEAETPAEFDPDGEAPMTEAKGVMSSNSRSDLELVVADVIEDVSSDCKILGVGPAVASMSHIKAEVLRRSPGLRDLTDKAMARCLTACDFRPMPGSEKGKAAKVMWHGERVRVWSRGGVVYPTQVVHAAFAQTMAGGFDD
jgi:hypothetical protein